MALASALVLGISLRKTLRKGCVVKGRMAEAINEKVPPPPQCLPGRWKTRHSPSRHCRDARVYGYTTTAMHETEHISPIEGPAPPPPPCPGQEMLILVLMAVLSGG